MAQQEVTQAFMLRIKPSHIDRTKMALNSNQIIIGWSKAHRLLEMTGDFDAFWHHIRETWPDWGNRSIGASAGMMWRFVVDMAPGSLVVVPYEDSFYVAEVVGAPLYLADKVNEDTAYRRDVKWLNEKKPIPRRIAKAALQSRMKARQTLVQATDLLDEIQDALKIAVSKDKPSFETDLRQKLLAQTLQEIRTGRLDSYEFENLIGRVLSHMGAKEVKVIPRSKDQGVDLYATFLVAETHTVIVGVQAKHWKPDPPVTREVVERLVQGMETLPDADFVAGWIVTSGKFSPGAEECADHLADQGKDIRLIDGDMLAAFIVDAGLGQSGFALFR